MSTRNFSGPANSAPAYQNGENDWGAASSNYQPFSLAVNDSTPTARWIDAPEYAFTPPSYPFSSHVTAGGSNLLPGNYMRSHSTVAATTIENGMAGAAQGSQLTFPMLDYGTRGPPYTAPQSQWTRTSQAALPQAVAPYNALSILGHGIPGTPNRSAAPQSQWAPVPHSQVMLPIPGPGLPTTQRHSWNHRQGPDPLVALPTLGPVPSMRTDGPHCNAWPENRPSRAHQVATDPRYASQGGYELPSMPPGHSSLHASDLAPQRPLPTRPPGLMWGQQMRIARSTVALPPSGLGYPHGSSMRPSRSQHDPKIPAMMAIPRLSATIPLVAAQVANHPRDTSSAVGEYTPSGGANLSAGLAVPPNSRKMTVGHRRPMPPRPRKNERGDAHKPSSGSISQDMDVLQERCMFLCESNNDLHTAGGSQPKVDDNEDRDRCTAMICWRRSGDKHFEEKKKFAAYAEHLETHSLKIVTVNENGVEQRKHVCEAIVLSRKPSSPGRIICGVHCQGLSGLARHLATVSDHQDPDSNSKAGVRCDTCGRHMSRDDALKRHKAKSCKPGVQDVANDTSHLLVRPDNEAGPIDTHLNKRKRGEDTGEGEDAYSAQQGRVSKRSR